MSWIPQIYSEIWMKWPPRSSHLIQRLMVYLYRPDNVSFITAAELSPSAHNMFSDDLPLNKRLVNSYSKIWEQFKAWTSLLDSSDTIWNTNSRVSVCKPAGNCLGFSNKLPLWISCPVIVHQGISCTFLYSVWYNYWKQDIGLDEPVVSSSIISMFLW